MISVADATIIAIYKVDEATKRRLRPLWPVTTAVARAAQIRGRHVGVTENGGERCWPGL
jgi:hypothetical protein